MESLQVSLFEEENKEDEEEDPNIFRPLADRMRPETLDEYVGQKQLVAKGNLLQKMIENDQITSMIFWGAARRGKNDPGPDYRQTDPVAFYQFLGGAERDQRNPGSHEKSGTEPACA